MILLVFPQFPPAIGGIQVQAMEFAKYLKRRQIPYYVLSNMNNYSKSVKETRGL